MLCKSGIDERYIERIWRGPVSTISQSPSGEWVLEPSEGVQVPQGFVHEWMMGCEINRWVRAVGAVLHALNHMVVAKRELSRKAKLLIYWSIFVPTFTNGHERWFMSERTRSRVQAAEMGFLRRVARDGVRSLAIREGLGVQPLLLWVERSQLRWFGHLRRMPPRCLPREVFLSSPTERRPRGRPRTRWRDYISSLAWERLVIPHSEFSQTTHVWNVY